MSEPEAPLLQVEDLQVHYGPVLAVRGISFQVGRGEIVTLIGANGAGKSSTLSAISGVIGTSGGRVLLEGQPVTGLSAARLVDRGVVLVPEGRAVLARLTVEENLRLGAFRRRDAKAVAKDVQGMLERFPVLATRRGRAAGSLSGGEQQMLAIARGLLAAPRLLLLDEPSMGLAPLIVRQVFELVQEIRAQGVTVLLVEQNARAALAIADRGYVLETGRVVFGGTAAELAADPRVQAAYVGAPVSAS